MRSNCGITTSWEWSGFVRFGNSTCLSGKLKSRRFSPVLLLARSRVLRESNPVKRSVYTGLMFGLASSGSLRNMLVFVASIRTAGSRDFGAEIWIRGVEIN